VHQMLRGQRSSESGQWRLVSPRLAGRMGLRACLNLLSRPAGLRLDRRASFFCCRLARLFRTLRSRVVS
jgi:hypothetical protein